MRLSKVFDDAYNCRELLILKDILNERVAEVVSFHPHDFSAKRVCLLEKDLWSDSPFS